MSLFCHNFSLVTNVGLITRNKSSQIICTLISVRGISIRNILRGRFVSMTLFFMRLVIVMMTNK